MRYLTQLEAKEIDTKLIQPGLTTEQLVEIAGYAAFEAITNIIQNKNRRIITFVGPGNNGADGLVISRWLQMTGHQVYVYSSNEKTNDLNDKLSQICLNLGVIFLDTLPNFKPDFVIDALFGYSFRGEIEEPYLSQLMHIKNFNNIISVDVPSGYVIDEVNKDPVFVPNYVVTMVAPKKCCQGIKCFVTRSFVPKSIFYDEEYTNFFSFVQLK